MKEFIIKLEKASAEIIDTFEDDANGLRFCYNHYMPFDEYDIRLQRIYNFFSAAHPRLILYLLEAISRYEPEMSFVGTVQCIHCLGLFSTETIGDHIQKCQSNPVVLENMRLKALLSEFSQNL